MNYLWQKKPWYKRQWLKIDLWLRRKMFGYHFYHPQKIQISNGVLITEFYSLFELFKYKRIEKEWLLAAKRYKAKGNKWG